MNRSARLRPWKELVILLLENTILLRRDHGLRPGGLDRRDEIISVLSLIREHRFGIMIFDQCLALADVGLLSPGRDELDGVAHPVDRDLQLGPEPTPRAPQRLVGAPFF
jgi:hypothetical protein